MHISDLRNYINQFLDWCWQFTTYQSKKLSKDALSHFPQAKFTLHKFTSWLALPSYHRSAEQTLVLRTFVCPTYRIYLFVQITTVPFLTDPGNFPPTSRRDPRMTPHPISTCQLYISVSKLQQSPSMTNLLFRLPKLHQITSWLVDIPTSIFTSDHN